MSERPRTSGRVPFLGALAHSTAGKLSVMVFGFATLMVVARRVSPTDIGTFLLMQTAAVFLNEVGSMGLHIALPKQLAESNGERADRLARTALSYRLCTIAVAAVVAWFGVDLVARLFPFEPGPGARWFVPALVVVEGLTRFWLAELQGRYRFRQVGLIQILGSVGNSAIALGLIWFAGLGIEALFVAKIASRVLTTGYGWAVVRTRPTVDVDRPALRELVRFGSILQANYLLSFVYQRIDTVLIAVFLGPASVAFYEIARRIPDSLIELHDAFSQVYLPFVSGLRADGEDGEVAGLVDTANRLSGAALGGLALGAFLFGESILSTLFSARYGESWVVFGLLTVAVLTIVFDSNIGSALVAVGDATRPTMIALVRTIVGLGLYLILLPAFGAVGAAATNSLSLLAVAPLAVLAARRRGIRPQIRGLVVPLVLIATLIGFRAVVAPDSVVVAVLLLVAYGAACIGSGLTSRGEIEAAIRAAVDRLPSSKSSGNQAAPFNTFPTDVSHRAEPGADLPADSQEVRPS